MTEIYKRWYLKMKADPVRYKAFLARGRKWNTKYRTERSGKYLQQLARRRARRSFNPFPHRERGRAYYNEIRADPVAYRAMLEKQRLRHQMHLERLRSKPEAYRAWLDERKVYHRYYRIMAAAQKEVPIERPRVP